MTLSGNRIPVVLLVDSKMTQIYENETEDVDGSPSSPITPSQLPTSAVPGDTATVANDLPPEETNVVKIDKECQGEQSDKKVLSSNPSICEKLRFLRNNVTVEPMLIFYIIPSVLANLATQNLNLEKACRVNLALGDEICTSLELRSTANYTGHEIRVQKLVAEMQIWKTLLKSSVPIILIMFLGSWSDRNRKRKPCMLLPIIGEFLTAVSLIVCTYFFYELPMQVTGVLEAVLSAMTGGWKTMFMAIYSYLGDISTDEDRTLRIGIVNTVYYVGIPIGTALSGVLYNKCGPYTILSIAAMLNVCSFFCGLIKIKERKYPPPDVVPHEDSKSIMEDNISNDNEQQKSNLTSKEWNSSSPEVYVNNDNMGEQQSKSITSKKSSNPSNTKKKRCFLSRFIRDFFDFQHIVEIFDVSFRNASVGRRKKTLGLIMIVVFVFGPNRGEMTVMYLFTRYRFNWNEVDYSVFSTYSMVTNLIGTLFSVGVFSHMLKIDDALIGVMSCMSKILAGFVYAFATTTWMIYLAPLVDIVNGTSFIAMRSIASKLVPPEELGKVNSLFGVCEALMPLVYGPMYSAVYASTMHTMPGAFFLLGGALTTPAVVIFAWMYTEHKKDELLAKISKENECKKENGDVKTQSDTVRIQVITTPPAAPLVCQHNPLATPPVSHHNPPVAPPTGQPQDAGFVNKAFESDETSRSS